MLDARDRVHAADPARRRDGRAARRGPLDLAASGGRSTAQEHRRTFGRGWDTTLDRTIADVATQASPARSALPRRPSSRRYQPAPPDRRPAPASHRCRPGASTRSARIRSRDPTAGRHEAGTSGVAPQGQPPGTGADRAVLHDRGADRQPAARADAQLEDANWQLAKKPSPDGRFNGVDIPGAMRDTEAALATLGELSCSGRPCR